MKKFIALALSFIFLQGLFALELGTAPEQHKSQLEVLRNLDIESNFIADINFSLSKDELKALHSKTLIRVSDEYYEFVPMVLRIIKEQDLPDEFLYLAMIESGFKMNARSRVKAVGIWQFMEPTARELGLKIDAYVDERKDPFKSSQAAANYLKGLKQEFGKWYLAILAYNCGSGKLSRAIKQAGSDELSVLLDADKKYLPLETRNFIRKILVLAFEANNKEFLFSQNGAFANYSFVNDFVKIEVPASVSLRELALRSKINYEELKKFNPHFRYDFTPPNSSSYIYIPAQKSASFLQNYEPKALAKVDTRLPHTKIYVVKSGDSLYSIAKKHKITVASIKAYNKLKKNHLSINQKLILPLKENDNAKNTQLVSR